ncbi:MAG: hypothetical protein IJ412_10800, partial [Oscillospiraceae bacterium]|nr:hypothetical protein [Oscillospiraceae bacterium]
YNTPHAKFHFACKFRRNLLQYLMVLALIEPKWRPYMGRQIKFDGVVAILQQLLSCLIIADSFSFQ